MTDHLERNIATHMDSPIIFNIYIYHYGMIDMQVEGYISSQYLIFYNMM